MPRLGALHGIERLHPGLLLVRPASLDPVEDVGRFRTRLPRCLMAKRRMNPPILPRRPAFDISPHQLRQLALLDQQRVDGVLGFGVKPLQLLYLGRLACFARLSVSSLSMFRYGVLE